MNVVAELLQAARRLAQSPRFTLLCLLTLALGSGASTAVFSVLNGVLLSPLPYPEPERLVALWHAAPGLGLPQMPQSPGTYLLYRDQARSFESLALHAETEVAMTDGSRPERLRAARVTASLFRVLRVAPKGRPFLAEEERPGARPVVVLSDRLWHRRFAAEPQILGRSLRIEGVEHEVVGILPAGFGFPSEETELWLPMPIDPADAPLGEFSPLGLARLKPGVSVADAAADLRRLLGDLTATFPDSGTAATLARAGFEPRVRPLREDVVGDAKGLLWSLFTAVGLILLIACANVANLLIVRTDGRRKATAVSAALGAPRSRLMAGILCESLLLGLCSGALGLGLAVLGLRLLVALQPAGLPRLAEVGIDGRVLAFTLLVSLLASLLFGMLPALRVTAAVDLASELRGHSRAVTLSRGRKQLRQGLVALQIALALILLAGSGLLLRSMLNLVRTPSGFASSDVLTLELALPAASYPDAGAAAAFLGRLAERLAAIPGVEAAGVTTSLPLSGSAEERGHELEGHPLERGEPPPVIRLEAVDGGYLRALGIPLLAGRGLQRADVEQRSAVVVVNRVLAQRFWPGQNAVGKRLRISTDDPQAPWYTVVGVAGDVRSRTLTEPPPPTAYYPLRGATDAWTPRRVAVVLRARVDPASLTGAVRTEIGRLDADLPVSNVHTAEFLVSRAGARTRSSMLLFLTATGIALLLSGIGVYGFLSYLVSQRTEEIGLRMAIGADARNIRWMICRESLLTAAAGVAAGLAGAAVLTRWLGSLLYGVSPLDPVTLLAVSVLLAGLVLLASLAPAQRAARLDPVTALLQRG